jgi:hypothetical protein
MRDNKTRIFRRFCTLSYKAEFFARCHNARWTDEIGYWTSVQKKARSIDLIQCEQGSTQRAIAPLFHFTEKVRYEPLLN